MAGDATHHTGRKDITCEAFIFLQAHKLTLAVSGLGVGSGWPCCLRWQMDFGLFSSFAQYQLTIVLKLTPYFVSIFGSGNGAGMFETLAFIFSREEKNLLAAAQIDNVPVDACDAAGVALGESSRRRGTSAGSASAPESARARTRILSCIFSFSVALAVSEKTICLPGRRLFFLFGVYRLPGLPTPRPKP